VPDVGAMPETTALTAEERAFLAQVKARVLELYPEAEVIASRASGLFEEYADWTIAIITVQKLTWQEKQQITKTIGSLEIESGQSIIEYIYSRDELEHRAGTQFMLDLMHDGIAI